jgi:hypothetical protein
MSNRKKIPLTVRLLAILMSLVVSGIGLLSILSEHAPERSTRFGVVSALDGEPAVTFGAVVFLIGLRPLGRLAPSRRAAVWFTTTVSVVALGVLFSTLYWR